MTPNGIHKLADNDIDSLKKERYRIKFRHNRRRLERLVLKKEELSKNTSLYKLLTEVRVIVFI